VGVSGLRSWCFKPDGASVSSPLCITSGPPPTSAVFALCLCVCSFFTNTQDCGHIMLCDMDLVHTVQEIQHIRDLEAGACAACV
jgi:hypothetical protein